MLCRFTQELYIFLFLSHTDISGLTKVPLPPWPPSGVSHLIGTIINFLSLFLSEIKIKVNKYD